MCYEGDAIVFARWAEAVSAGRAADFNSGLPFYPPAVAYLIAWLTPARAAPDFVALKVGWCVMSAAAVAFAYLAFAAEFGRRVATIAATMGVFSFGLAQAATSVNADSPYLLLVVLLVLAAQRLAARPSWVIGATFGLLNGLANLFRPEHTLLFLLLLAWIVWRWRPWLAPRSTASTSPRPAALLVTVVVFMLTLAPWSVHATRANIRYNTTAAFTPDYDRMAAPWSPDARAFFDALPEFCKRELGAYLEDAVARRGLDRVTADDLRSVLLADFGHVPEPVRAFTLVASSGPIAFALANHPAAGGGFSKAALDSRFNPDPDINLALPTHLYLYNHGLSAGWALIAADPAASVRNVVHKLSNFWSGVTPGLTARNVPIGRDGRRRAVDLLTHEPGAAIAWRWTLTAAILIGVGLAVARRRGAPWLIVIASKLVVTVLFFGYARQAVSILPAFHLMAAIAIDAAITRLRVPPRVGRLAAAAILLALAIFDGSYWLRPAEPSITGRVRLLPQWDAAFESPQDLTIRWTRPGRGVSRDLPSSPPP